jgi:hypothetical protein
MTITADVQPKHAETSHSTGPLLSEQMLTDLSEQVVSHWCPPILTPMACPVL